MNEIMPFGDAIWWYVLLGLDGNLILLTVLFVLFSLFTCEVYY